MLLVKHKLSKNVLITVPSKFTSLPTSASEPFLAPFVCYSFSKLSNGLSSQQPFALFRPLQYVEGFCVGSDGCTAFVF